MLYWKHQNDADAYRMYSVRVSKKFVIEPMSGISQTTKIPPGFSRPTRNNKNIALSCWIFAGFLLQELLIVLIAQPTIWQQYKNPNYRNRHSYSLRRRRTLQQRMEASDFRDIETMSAGKASVGDQIANNIRK